MSSGGKQVAKQVSEAERYRRQLEAVFANATVALFLMDEQQHCVFMNAAAERLTGYRLAEVQGRPLHDVLHHTRPDGSHYPLEECPIDRAFPQNNREQGEEVFVHKDGSFYPVAYTASPIREEGAIVGTIIEVQDLRAEKAREAALQRSEERFRTLITTQSAVVWVTDGQGALLDSPLWQSYTGQTPQDYAGWGWLEMVHPEDRPHVQTLWAQALQARRLYEIEYRLWHHSGEYHYVRANGAPLLDEEGSVREWVGSITDIHERKQAQEALRQTNVLLEDALSTGGVMVWVWDIARNVVTGNPLLAHLFAVDPQSITKGMPLEPFIAAIHEENRARVQEAIMRAIETGETYLEEYRVLNADGLWRWVTVRGHASYDAQGQAKTFVGVLLDITDRKDSEAALTETNLMLEQRVQERTAQLQAANAALESFNYSVAHDLRAPLRGMDGFCGMLLEDYADVLDQEGKGYLERIQAGTARMNALIGALLELSQLTRRPLNRQEVNLSDLATDILAELHMREPERRIMTNIEPNLMVSCDPTLLRIALENLLGNAWKFTRKRTDACIELHKTSGKGGDVFLVNDNGAGFDMQYADKLFAPFQRLHNPQDFVGIGIGLATVARIITKHGGTIWAHGESDKGANFYFTLEPGK